MSVYAKTPKYDIVVRDANGNLHGIEVKSGTATRDTSQLSKDIWVNKNGGNGVGKLAGKKVLTATTIYVP